MISIRVNQLQMKSRVATQTDLEDTHGALTTHPEHEPSCGYFKQDQSWTPEKLTSSRYGADHVLFMLASRPCTTLHDLPEFQLRQYRDT